MWQPGERPTCRGFGFITFKSEWSAIQAVQQHYFILCGKEVGLMHFLYCLYTVIVSYALNNAPR